MTRVTIKLHKLADQTNNVELILKPAIGDKWFALLDRRDSIALPYEPVNYTDSYSAISSEALALTRPHQRNQRTVKEL